jgi:hypothetical protein
MYWLETLLHNLIKFVYHLLTGKSELQRITEQYPSQRLKIVQQLRRSISLSKQLPSSLKAQLFDVKVDDFSVKEVASTIKQIKKFENPGLIFAISSLRRTKIGILHLEKLSKQEYTNEYESSLLELWRNLKPGQELKGSNVRHSESWSEIGFQGLDPATDFRGAGMLSLENLKYFAKENPEVARRILTEQCSDVTQGGFPFAVTGINLTAFLLQLVLKRKLDDLLLFISSEAEELANTTIRASSRRTRVHNDGLSGVDERSPLLGNGDQDRVFEQEHEDDDQTRQLALERFNVAYSVVFTMFSNRWREAAPRDAMGFPSVFLPFKQEIEALIQTQEGINVLARL